MLGSRVIALLDNKKTPLSSLKNSARKRYNTETYLSGSGKSWDQLKSYKRNKFIRERGTFNSKLSISYKTTHRRAWRVGNGSDKGQDSDTTAARTGSGRKSKLQKLAKSSIALKRHQNLNFKGFEKPKFSDEQVLSIG